MPILRSADNPVRLHLEVSDVLVVTVPAGGAGTVIDESPPSSTTTLSAGSSTNFGPYSSAKYLTVDCTADAVFYSIPLRGLDPSLDAAMQASGYTKGGGGATVRPAGTSIVLDAQADYAPLSIAGATALTISGSTRGAAASMTVIANGTNAPTISGADEWASSFGYLNSSGTPNRLDAWFDGVAARYSWSQQMVPTVVDVTAPTLSSAAVNGAALTLVYSEALNTTSPATSAFSVAGAGSTTQAPSAVSISGSTVTLTLATPAVFGDTVTVGYTVPGSNPIRDTAGNSAGALVSQAVTNNTASTAEALFTLGTLIKLTNASDVYTADSSAVTSFGAYGRSSLALAGDGYVSVDWASDSNGAVILGLDKTNTINWANGETDSGAPDFYMLLSTSTTTVSRGANTQTATSLGAAITPSGTARYRIKRTGTTVTIEESSNSGSTWSTRYTFAGSSTGTLYAFAATVQSNVIYRPRQVGFA